MKPVDGPIQSVLPVTTELLRNALGRFATGVAVVTTLGPAGEPIGLTVDSFNSVSMDPPLILWSLALQAPSLPAFRSHPSFIVNILSGDQLDLCRQFAASGADKFAGVGWSAGLHGAPVLEGNHATLHCLNYQQYPGGDHEIFLGEVAQVQIGTDSALVYHLGQFANLNK